MSNYVLESLRLEQSQIDTLLEVIADSYPALYANDESIKEDIENLDCFDNLDSVDGVPAELAYEIIDAVRDRIMESVLEISTITTKRILLGCGGPTRYIEIDFDDDGDVTGGRYYDNAGAMNDKSVEVERCLNVSEAQAFADRYNLGEG